MNGSSCTLGRPEVWQGENLGIRRGITCAICGDGRVPHDCCGGEVGHARCELVGVVDEVPPCRDAYSVRVIFLGSKIYHYPCVRDDLFF